MHTLCGSWGVRPGNPAAGRCCWCDFLFLFFPHGTTLCLECSLTSSPSVFKRKRVELQIICYRSKVCGEKDVKLFSTLIIIIRNVYWAPNQHICLISEGSCDTKDHSNKLCIHRNKLNCLNIYKIETIVLIFHDLTGFTCFFYQMNAALVNIRDLNKHYKILTTPPFLTVVYIFVFFKALQALIKKTKKTPLSCSPTWIFIFRRSLYPRSMFQTKSVCLNPMCGSLRADVITLGCEE